MLRCVEQTRVYEIGKVPKPVSEPREKPTAVHVWNGDCLVAAKKLLDANFRRVVVLNMANATNPGGGYLGGDGAQEENLHRRSTYSAVLGDPYKMTGAQIIELYPIYVKAVYSPGVQVFRGEERLGYPLLDTPFFVDMLAVAAVRNPALALPDTNTMAKVPEALMKNLIGHMLQVAALHEADALVLSAFGCGAFRCPPRHVAALFREEILRQASTQGNRFGIICFAIFEDHNSKQSHNPEGNVKPFADAFGVEAHPVETAPL